MMSSDQIDIMSARLIVRREQLTFEAGTSADVLVKYVAFRKMAVVCPSHHQSANRSAFRVLRRV